MNKNWGSVNLTKEDSELFRKFLIDNGIRFETSENGILTHFEVLVDGTEKTACDKFLSSI